MSLLVEYKYFRSINEFENSMFVTNTNILYQNVLGNVSGALRKVRHSR